MTDKPQTTEENVTYFYGSEKARLTAAQGMYEAFCEDMKKSTEWARSRFISSMQISLRTAFNQGVFNPPHSNPEDMYIQDSENACQHCGGSGHKDDSR